MTAPREPDPVKLFVGALYSERSELQRIRPEIVERFGPIDYESPIYPFDVTDYYAAEMGQGLSRIFWSFERLADPAALVEAKLFCNELEGAPPRKVNLDPGYLDYYKVVLASAKFGGQKIYLGRGIYGDIVLWYEKGAFKPFIWGFPDFKNGRYDAALLEIRGLYSLRLRAES
jgi:hypothetical protein